MAALNHTVKSFVAGWIARHAPAPHEAPAEDAEQIFRASIAHLSSAEQQEQIIRREWYRRLAERQGIIEVETYPERWRGAGR